jgi:putative tricarboxylic transport membrane protein
MAEENLRKALILSKGSYLVFIKKPVSLLFLIFTILALVIPFYINIRTMKKDHDERIVKVEEII